MEGVCPSMNVELLNISKINDSGSSSYQAKKSSTIVSEYAKILAAKMATARDDMREMNYIQSKLDEIRELQEEITGKIQDSKTSGNAAAGNSSGKGAIDKIPG